MNNKLNQYISIHNGKPLEVEDPSNRDQCMDNAFGWCDFIGLDRAQIRNEYAKDVWTHHGNKLTPTNSPVAGDFVVWGTLVGSSGHIGIFKSGNTQSFVSFDENWNNVLKCLEVPHTNYGVLGFLHIGANMATDSLTKEEIISVYTGFFDLPDNQTPGDLISAYTGKPLDGLLQQLHADPTYQAHFQAVNNPTIPNSTTLKPGNYNVL